MDIIFTFLKKYFAIDFFTSFLTSSDSQSYKDLTESVSSWLILTITRFSITFCHIRIFLISSRNLVFWHSSVLPPTACYMLWMFIQFYLFRGGWYPRWDFLPGFYIQTSPIPRDYKMLLETLYCLCYCPLDLSVVHIHQLHTFVSLNIQDYP